MDWIFACPHCEAMLNPVEAVILLGRRREQSMLVGFDPKPGSYRVYVPPGVATADGERWQFFCPVCRTDLVTDFADSLCAVDIKSEGEDHRVFFSRVAGDQATFVVGRKGVEEQHGRDVERYSSEAAHMKYLL